MLSRKRDTAVSIPNGVGKAYAKKTWYVSPPGARALLRNIAEDPTVARMQTFLGVSDRLLGFMHD